MDGEWLMNGERMSFRPLLQECDITIKIVSSPRGRRGWEQD